jgi:hypothetical protein
LSYKKVKQGALMRNLAQYPITEDEKIAAVRAALDTLEDLRPGDIKRAALNEVLKELEARKATAKA